MIEKYYEYPWNIYLKYFPNGNENEFDKAFVSFDVSKKEFKELTNNSKGNFICLETVIFDLDKIKTPINKSIKNLKNTFRK